MDAFDRMSEDELRKIARIMNESLGQVQSRSTELLDEARALRRALLIRLDQRMTAWGAPAAIATEQVNILIDLLKVLRDRKQATGTGHASWRDVVLEEVLELLTAESDDRVEAEAIDVANVVLKMVEARRARRARTEAK